MVDQAVAWLVEQVPDASDVLDVGSGPGVAACSFAESLPGARVLAVDGAEPLLTMARERASRLGVGERLRTRQVSLPADLADLSPADLVWVSGVAHHLPDPVATLRALGALVRPGGLLALREGGLPMRFLPDGAVPGLLPRLDAIGEELVAAHEHPAGIVPRQLSWPDLMREAGLRASASRSFLLDLPAPASPAVRRYVLGRLGMVRESFGDQLTPADAATLAQLVDEDDPVGILRRPDLFLLTATTVHIGRP